MAVKEFDDKTNLADADLGDPDEINDAFTGVQNRFEEQLEAFSQNGIESGCALAIDGTSVDLGAGVCWCEGVGLEPADTPWAFTGSDASGTWYLYMDPTNRTSPLQKVITTSPGDAYLVFGTVDWDGATTLSALVDFGRMGILPHVIPFFVKGAVSAELILAWTNPGMDGRSFRIWGLKGGQQENGSGGGPCYVDAHAGTPGSEVTIFTTQTRRLTLAHDDANGSVQTAGEPQANQTVAPGEKVLIIVDAVTTGSPTDLFGCLYGCWF